MAEALEVRNLTLGHGRGAPVIRDLNLSIPPGKVTVLVGPNGSGKSTLLMALARILRPRAGKVLLGGRPLDGFSPRDLARRLALLSQQPQAPEGLTLRDLVVFGRHPRRGLLSPWRPEDEAAVTRALDATDLSGLAHRPLEALSGGQRQRGWIAMTLAQEADILVLDEPTSFLDIAHQMDVLDLLRDLNRRMGTTVVAALHDLGQAARYADRVAVLRDGALSAFGPPDEVLTPATIAEVWGVDGCIVGDSAAGAVAFLPLRRRA